MLISYTVSALEGETDRRSLKVDIVPSGNYILFRSYRKGTKKPEFSIHWKDHESEVRKGRIVVRGPEVYVIGGQNQSRYTGPYMPLTITEGDVEKVREILYESRTIQELMKKI